MIDSSASSVYSQDMPSDQILIEFRMLLPIAESILELHAVWCGSPLNPLYAHHNPACLAAAERLKQETR